jgi:type VI secretion system VgrG family protein
MNDSAARLEPICVRLVLDQVDASSLQIAKLTGRETISRLFEYELTVVCTSAEGIDAEAVLEKAAALVFSRGSVELRTVCGMIAQVDDQLDTETQATSYRLSFVPRAYLLGMTEMLDVFLDMSVPEIIAHKLESLQFKKKTQADAPYDFELRLRHPWGEGNGPDEYGYPKREFIVQYKETDLAFISRLCEHIGISFFFEHVGGRDVMVFVDGNDGMPWLGDPLAFRPRGEGREIFQLEQTVKMIPGSYVVRDYNYRTPRLDLSGQAELKHGSGLVIEYGAHVKSPQEAEFMAKVRAQEKAAARRVFRGKSDQPVLAAGSRFEIHGHPRGDVKLVATELRHELTQPTALHGASVQEHSYGNSFEAILESRRFRPPRITPKPRIHGVVNGVIDADADSEYAKIDAEGRYRVQFLFDATEPDRGKASRLVRMAQPHSGPGYGMHFPLRPGVEVIITFVDGDPDRPIIAATVPNAQTPSPVNDTNAAKNVIRTGGGNEFAIDDTKDSHRIKLSTPHLGTVFQLGSKNAPENGGIFQSLGAFTTVAGAGVASYNLGRNLHDLWKNNAVARDITSIAKTEKMTAGPRAIQALQTMVSLTQNLLKIVKAIRTSPLDQLEALKNKAAKVEDTQKNLDWQYRSYWKEKLAALTRSSCAVCRTVAANADTAMQNFGKLLAQREADEAALRRQQKAQGSAEDTEAGMMGNAQIIAAMGAAAGAGIGAGVASGAGGGGKMQELGAGAGALVVSTGVMGAPFPGAGDNKMSGGVFDKMNEAWKSRWAHGWASYDQIVSKDANGNWVVQGNHADTVVRAAMQVYEDNVAIAAALASIKALQNHLLTVAAIPDPNHPATGVDLQWLRKDDDHPHPSLDDFQGGKDASDDAISKQRAFEDAKDQYDQDDNWKRIKKAEDVLNDYSGLGFGILSWIMDLWGELTTSKATYDTANKWVKMATSIGEVKPVTLSQPLFAYPFSLMGSPQHVIGAEHTAVIYGEKRSLYWSPTIALYAPADGDPALDATATAAAQAAVAARKAATAAIENADNLWKAGGWYRLTTSKLRAKYNTQMGAWYAANQTARQLAGDADKAEAEAKKAFGAAGSGVVTIMAERWVTVAAKESIELAANRSTLVRASDAVVVDATDGRVTMFGETGVEARAPKGSVTFIAGDSKSTITATKDGSVAIVGSAAASVSGKDDVSISTGSGEAFLTLLASKQLDAKTDGWGFAADGSAHEAKVGQFDPASGRQLAGVTVDADKIALTMTPGSPSLVVSSDKVGIEAADKVTIHGAASVTIAANGRILLGD